MIALKKAFTDKYYILADQILTSLMNFGSIFLLSNFLDASVFSEFVVLYSYITLNNVFLLTVFSTPILVFAVKKWADSHWMYFIYVLIFFLILGTLLTSFEYIFLQMQIKNVGYIHFLLMAIGLSIMDLIKRYIFSNKVIPLIITPISSLITCLIFFGAIFLFRHQLNLNLILFIYIISCWTSFAIMFTLVVISSHIKQHKFNLTSLNCKTGKAIFSTHYHYSKWVLAGSVSFWAYSQGIYIFGNLMGISDAIISKTRTIQNLFGVFTIIFATLENYLTPIYAKKAMISERLIPKITHEFYQRNSLKFTIFSLLTIPIMYLVYYIFYHQKFGDGLIFILILWATQFIAISTKPISIALKAKEVTYPLFFSHLYGALAILIPGGIFIAISETWGFICTILVSYIVANFANYIYYKKIFKTIRIS